MAAITMSGFLGIGGQMWSGKGLRKVKAPVALLLEGSLDPDLSSERSEARILSEWLLTHEYPISLFHKNIHTLDDLNVFGKSIKKAQILLVHINCHGSAAVDSKGPFIELYPGNKTYLLDDENINILKAYFEGQDVFFEACTLGRYQKQMAELRQAAGFRTLAAYSREVYDYEAVLFSLCLYHGMLGENHNFPTAATKAVEALAAIGIHGSRGRDQHLVRIF